MIKRGVIETDFKSGDAFAQTGGAVGFTAGGCNQSAVPDGSQSRSQPILVLLPVASKANEHRIEWNAGRDRRSDTATGAVQRQIVWPEALCIGDVGSR